MNSKLHAQMNLNVCIKQLYAVSLILTTQSFFVNFNIYDFF